VSGTRDSVSFVEPSLNGRRGFLAGFWAGRRPDEGPWFTESQIEEILRRWLKTMIEQTRAALSGSLAGVRR